MKPSLLFLVCTMLCSGVLRAGSVEIFTTFGAGQVYDDAASGLTVGDGAIADEGDSVAVPFTIPGTGDPGFAYALSEVQFAGFTGDTGDAVTVALYGNNGAVPGSAIESFSTVLGSDPAIVTVNSVANPILASGQQYWIVLSDPQEEATWNNADATLALSNDWFGVALLSNSSGWSFSDSYTQGAVEVDAVLVPNVPEPGTFLAFGSGLSAIVILLRRRRVG